MNCAYTDDFAYVGCTKTGSCAVSEWMKEALGASTCWFFRHVPRAVWRKPVVVSVRDPYSRCVSLFVSVMKQDGDRYGFRQAVSDGTMEGMLRFLIQQKGSKTRNIDLMLTQMEQIEIVSRTSYRIIHHESLEKGIEALPWVNTSVELPVINRKKNRDEFDTEELLTPQVIELIHQWCPEDFKFLGYEKRTV